MEFVGFGVCRASHTAQVVVQAEVILEGDRGQRLVFGLNWHTFFGFDRLVQTLAPAPTRHQATGEFVHDNDFTVLHHIVLVAVVQVVGAQCRIQMVHQRDVGWVVQRGTRCNQALRRQHALGGFVALLGQKDLVGFLVQREVARLGDALASTRVGFALLAHQQRHHLVHCQVHGGVVFGLAADDQRRARLVDQNRIDLVDDGVVEFALHPVAGLVDHVVAQVVKTVLVVSAVGDVGRVGRLLFFTRHIGQVDAN